MKSHVCALTIAAAIALLFGLAAEPVVSQTPSNATAQTSLQVPVDDVELDMAVRDKHNKPVLDLQPDQIAVTDNGAPVKLTDLRLVSGKQQNEPLITLLFDRPGIEVSQKDAENSLFGGSASSARETSEALRRAAAKFLKNFPTIGFQFGVMDIWGRLQIQQEYTADRKAITQGVSTAIRPGQYGDKVTANAVEQRMAQIAKTGQDPSGAAVNMRERALARSMVAALQNSTRISKDQHMSLSLGCLLALMEAQQSLPGRKAIVYFPSTVEGSGSSNGRTSRDSRAQVALESIIEAANRAGVNVYVVRQNDLAGSDQMASIFNSFGMMSVGSADINMNSSLGSTSQVPGPNMYSMASAGQFAGAAEFRAMGSKQASISRAHDSLDLLASQTGGDVLDADENISAQVKQLIRGLTTYYEASYVPPSEIQDGSFHATAVKPLRSGLKVRTRTGYLALPPSAGIAEAPQPFEVPLMALLKRPELPGEVDYQATVLRIEHQDEGNLSLLALEMPVSRLQIREDASTHLDSAHVSVLATISDSSGTVIERFSEDIARRWAPGGSTGPAQDFITFERSFAAPPGTYVLETAILDNNSGKAAAKRQSFEISASRAMPELSDLVMVRGMEPADVDDSDSQPLLYGDQRVQPNLDGQIAAGTHQISVFLLAHLDPKSLEPATVKLEVLRDGIPLKGAPLVSALKSGSEFYPVLKSFSISSAADGQYQVRATVTQGGKSAESTGTFALTGGEGHETARGAGEASLQVDPPGLEAAKQAIERPGAEELDRILADVSKNATDYGDALPNLICQQTTARSIDSRGDGNWKPKDTIVEVLTYVNHEENRTLVGSEENHAKRGANDAINNGMISAGEFGQALSAIFKPISKAEFTWKQTGVLHGEPVEIFEYRIERANSHFSLNIPTGTVRLPSGSVMAGYHGRIYVDRATHGVRSVTMITDDVPRNFPIRSAAVRVDYDYVAINDHDYLLPVSAQVVVGQNGSALERNDLEFSNFRRFGSSVRVLTAGEETTR